MFPFNITGIENLKEVLEQISEIAANWSMFGLALEIKNSELNAINRKENLDCLMEVVSLWLKGNGGETTWKFLCEALRSTLVKNPAIAKKIENKKL